MTEEEFIRQARVDWPDDNIRTLLDALEAYYMNGVYDDIGGNVDWSTGHYYRIERWIVNTDSQGFKGLETYSSNLAAEAAIGRFEDGTW